MPNFRLDVHRLIVRTMKICAVALVAGASAALAQEVTADESRAKAAAEFPDLSNPSSVFAKAYAAEEAQLRASQAGFFSDDNWPLMLAYRVAMKLGISGKSDASSATLAQSTATLSPPDVTASEAATTAAHHITPFILTIKGDQGSGSGFLLRREGKIYLVTNAHVIDGNSKVNVASIDREFSLPSRFLVSKTRDLVLAEVSGFSDGLEAETDFSQAKIGDATLSLGNSSGAGVSRLTAGKILGIGNDLVETDAPYVQGNSGSPIISVKSTRVLGVVTYVKRSPSNRLVAESDLKELRHFAHRVDNLSNNDFVTSSLDDFHAGAKLVMPIVDNNEKINAAIEAAQAAQAASPYSALLYYGAYDQLGLLTKRHRDQYGSFEVPPPAFAEFEWNGHQISPYADVIMSDGDMLAAGIFVAVQDIPNTRQISGMSPYHKRQVHDALAQRLALIDELGINNDYRSRGFFVKVDKNGKPMRGSLLKREFNFRANVAEAVERTRP